MITVSILINGQPIYTRSAVNKGELKNNKELCEYHVDNGLTILHNPKDGAVKLAKRLLDTIKEEK